MTDERAEIDALELAQEILRAPFATGSADWERERRLLLASALTSLQQRLESAEKDRDEWKRGCEAQAQYRNEAYDRAEAAETRLKDAESRLKELQQALERIQQRASCDYGAVEDDDCRLNRSDDPKEWCFYHLARRALSHPNPPSAGTE